MVQAIRHPDRRSSWSLLPTMPSGHENNWSCLLSMDSRATLVANNSLCAVAPSELGDS